MKTLFDTDEWEYRSDTGVLYRRGCDGYVIKSFCGMPELVSSTPNSYLDILFLGGVIKEIRDGVQ